MVLDEAVHFVFSVYGHVEIIFSDGNVDSESSLISFSWFIEDLHQDHAGRRNAAP